MGATFDPLTFFLSPFQGGEEVVLGDALQPDGGLLGPWPIFDL